MPKKKELNGRNIARGSAVIATAAAVIAPAVISNSSIENRHSFSESKNESPASGKENTPALVPDAALDKTISYTLKKDSLGDDQKRIEVLQTEIGAVLDSAVVPAPGTMKTTAKEESQTKTENAKEVEKPLVMTVEECKNLFRQMITAALSEKGGKTVLAGLDMHDEGGALSFTAKLEAPAAFGATFDINISGTLAEYGGVLSVAEKHIKAAGIIQKRAEKEIGPLLDTIGLGFAKYISKNNAGKQVAGVALQNGKIVVNFTPGQ